MRGEKQKTFKPQLILLEQYVSANHFYRKLEAKVDLSFVRELVKDYYAARLGRPSIDPVVFLSCS